MSEVASFAVPGFRGELVPAFRPLDLPATVARLGDPGHGGSTVHWGRNYLYATRLDTVAGPVEAVVKQFVSRGWRQRLQERVQGSKAAKHWRAAEALLAAGLATPQPLLLVESAERLGPSFLVTHRLQQAIEVRHYLRAVNGGRARELYPQLPVETFLDELARTLWRLHEARIWHRDVSVGNLLVELAADGGRPVLHFLDLNRARLGRPLSVAERSRDLARLRIFAPDQQRRFLAAYWARRPRALAAKRLLYLAFHKSFLWRTDAKDAVRARLRKLAPRTAHPHIPPAPHGAGARDRVSWDALSDQPHQHAGRVSRAAVRLSDAGAHLAEAATLGRAAPRIWRRYRRLGGERRGCERPASGIGVAVTPWPRDAEALLAAVDDLGVERVYLRLAPWDPEAREPEEALAAALSERGCELAFGLPQDRSLVRDPERWERLVEEIARRLTPYGRHFQVGQAINRSKWGIWRYAEYETLLARAARVLRRYDGVELLGPAVIDFEFHATATVLNRPWNGIRLDAVSSLLYVDRRGAPESRQLGFDTVGKVTLLKAIAETARNSGNACWITEVNWPLWEGPHAPAGKSVAVDESTQADYLVRYYLLALGTGFVERIYWWQLVARGYGLLCPEQDGVLRRRPGFHALRTLAAQLEGATGLRPLEAPAGARLYACRRRDGGERLIAWTTGAPLTIDLPAVPRAVTGRDGEALPLLRTPRIELGPSPRYIDL